MISRITQTNVAAVPRPHLKARGEKARMNAVHAPAADVEDLPLHEAADAQLEAQGRGRIERVGPVLREL